MKRILIFIAIFFLSFTALNLKAYEEIQDQYQVFLQALGVQFEYVYNVNESSWELESEKLPYYIYAENTELYLRYGFPNQAAVSVYLNYYESEEDYTPIFQLPIAYFGITIDQLKVQSYFVPHEYVTDYIETNYPDIHITRFSITYKSEDFATLIGDMEDPNADESSFVWFFKEVSSFTNVWSMSESLSIEYLTSTGTTYEIVNYPTGEIEPPSFNPAVDESYIYWLEETSQYFWYDYDPLKWTFDGWIVELEGEHYGEKVNWYLAKVNLQEFIKTYFPVIGEDEHGNPIYDRKAVFRASYKFIGFPPDPIVPNDTNLPDKLVDILKIFGLHDGIGIFLLFIILSFLIIYLGLKMQLGTIVIVIAEGLLVALGIYFKFIPTWSVFLIAISLVVSILITSKKVEYE